MRFDDDLKKAVDKLTTLEIHYVQLSKIHSREGNFLQAAAAQKVSVYLMNAIIQLIGAVSMEIVLDQATD